MPSQPAARVPKPTDRSVGAGAETSGPVRSGPPRAGLVQGRETDVSKPALSARPVLPSSEEISVSAFLPVGEAGSRDDDAEELSGSLLIDEPTGQAVRLTEPAKPPPPSKPGSRPPPLTRRTSSVPPPLPQPFSHPPSFRSAPPPLRRSSAPAPSLPRPPTAAGAASTLPKPPPLAPSHTLATANGASPAVSDDARRATRQGPPAIAAPAPPGPASANAPAVGMTPAASAPPQPHVVPAVPPPVVPSQASPAAPLVAPSQASPPAPLVAEPHVSPAVLVATQSPTVQSPFAMERSELRAAAAEAAAPEKPPGPVAQGPRPAGDSSAATGLSASEAAAIDALPTVPLPSLAAAPSSPSPVIPEAPPTVPAAADEAPTTDESLPSTSAKAGSDRISSWRPKLVLGPLPVLLAKIRRAARTVATAATEQYRSIATLRLMASERRPRWLLAAVAIAGLGVGVGIVALAMSLTSRRSEEVPEANRASASATASAGVAPKALEGQGTGALAPAAPIAASAGPAAGGAPEVVPAPPLASLSPCTVSGAAKNVAPSVLVAAGVEVRALADDVALGFAPNEHQAQALRVDLNSLAVSSTVTARSKTTIGRVTPSLSAKGALRVLVDTDRKGDVLRGRRTMPVPSSVQVGASGSDLVWARPGGGPGGTLWPIDAGSQIDAVRASSQSSGDDSITAVAFRSGGSIEVGLASGRDALTSKGELAKFVGLGPAVGAPAIAMNDDVVFVAWADRPSADVPWRLRWVRFKAGDAPDKPQMFTPPGGGAGDQAMSPSIAAVPGKRFLLVWTEGLPSQHEVRAITLSEDGAPLGAPLVLSTAGVNAGQGQAAIAASGRGVVAFLESSEDHFKLAVTPIACAL